MSWVVTLFLHQPPTLSNADAEAQAIHEENDLRVAMGLTPRDEHQLSSGCGCPGGCCIVASVASGSSYSEEVGELRRLRDGTLRCSRIGEVLFDHIHREYSLQSCGLPHHGTRSAGAHER